MALRSASRYVALPAATTRERACCSSVSASPSERSVCVMTTWLASTARWFASSRPMLASARSARAAAAGSSLALATRLPLVIWSCSADRSACRRVRVSMPVSNELAVLIRMVVVPGVVSCRSAADLQQAVEHRLRDLQHLGRRLVALLVLDEACRFLVEVDTRLVGRGRRRARGDGGRLVGRRLRALH